ncbi:hypothetical protein N7457_003498 [Penicillium paradoxum]|uniref:uncharacterized protein n=1 Tax=Penicillium paradoxum TaxID=176176 RepID=UPI00254955CC|nr:uncharacterized protein N7457_003498 [Penicillium paradoxum]KAJ5788508.1 hypothetical protein N7457_003498 [Penicillium paradoxum]
MRARPKRDSSYASNRLTRDNPPPGHLLSTYRDSETGGAKTRAAKSVAKATQLVTKTKCDVDTNDERLSSDKAVTKDTKANIVQSSIETGQDVDIDAEPLSSDEEETANKEADIAQPSIEKKTDVDTDADPVSSEEEDSDEDSLPDRKEVNYTTKTLKEKLAAKNNGSQTSPEVRNGNLRKSHPARNFSNMMGSDDEDSLVFSGSSQPFKRRKEKKYPSRFSNKSSLPPRSPATRRESSPAVEASKEPDAAKEPEDSFIVPKDICSSGLREPRGGEESNSSFSHGAFSLEDLKALGSDDSPLSSPSSSICGKLSQSEELGDKEDRQLAPAPKALCPLCHKEVDPMLLEIFRSQKKQRIREQVQFCESHKIHSAVEQWNERGYPTMDWENFEERVQSYFPKLEKLLVPGTFSYYRNILDASFSSGQAKNSRLRAEDDKGLEMMTCGYYGALGATKMLEVVIRRFSVLVRRLAITDSMIKAVGVAGYTQSVIVPELAVLMVKDDMEVNDEDARQILRESMDIGGLLHPDHNVVPIPEEEEGEKEQREDEEEEEL